MTVQELINELAKMPPMMEVWQQTYPTALNRVEKVTIDKSLGIVELHYEK